MLLVSLLLAASLSTADATLFAERLAQIGYGPPPVVTMGALPPDWTPPVPLPQSAPLLGSVFHVNNKSVELLYAPNDAAAAFSAYQASLQRSGFAPAHSVASVFASGGFVEQNPQRQNALLCRGPQGVTLRLLPGNDLRVNISSANMPAMFNPCTSARLSPEAMLGGLAVLPSLRAPDGVTVTPDAGGITTAGFGPSGASANITYGATFDGNTSVAQLFDTFITQLKSDGWRQDGTGQSQNGAFGAFSRDLNGQQWKAHLLVYPGDKPRLFRGLLTGSGEPLEKPQPPPPPHMPRIPVAIAKSETPVVLELMRRIVDVDGNGASAVFLRKAPTDLPKTVSLPRGMLLGSTIVINDFDSRGNDTLYYDLTRPELDAYQQTLERAGWNANAAFVRSSGFVSAADTEPVDFCKQGEPTLTVSAQPGSNAVTIMLVRSATLGGCHTMPAPPNEFPQLPKLVTPGARASHLWTTDGGSASAFLSAQSPPALIDTFTAQMRTQGWRPVNRIANTLSGTATFVRTSGTRALTATITVSRTRSSSRAYVASMTVY
jgi:hypothetical protein